MSHLIEKANLAAEQGELEKQNQDRAAAAEQDHRIQIAWAFLEEIFGITPKALTALNCQLTDACLYLGLYVPGDSVEFQLLPLCFQASRKPDHQLVILDKNESGQLQISTDVTLKTVITEVPGGRWTNRPLTIDYSITVGKNVIKLPFAGKSVFEWEAPNFDSKIKEVRLSLNDLVQIGTTILGKHFTPHRLAEAAKNNQDQNDVIVAELITNYQKTINLYEQSR